MDTPSVIYTLVIGVMMGVGVLGFFIWGVATGAFENAEDAKYMVFRDEDDD